MQQFPNDYGIVQGAFSQWSTLKKNLQTLDKNKKINPLVCQAIKVTII